MLELFLKGNDICIQNSKYYLFICFPCLFLTQMKQRGLKVEPVAYTGLFNACAHSPWPTTDGLQRATRLRTQLKEKGYQFNQIVSHALIKGVYHMSDVYKFFLNVSTVEIFIEKHAKAFSVSLTCKIYKLGKYRALVVFKENTVTL